MSARATRAAKRNREESAHSGAPAKKPRQKGSAGYQRDREFWEEDGTIVLIARNVGFKVYKGVLAHHSPVFADMFSLPQPADAADPSTSAATQGCAEVHLDDSPEDLRHVLRAVLPRKQGRVIHGNLTFDAISACLRLSHKYQIDHLQTEAIDFMKGYFTDFDRASSLERVAPPGWELDHVFGVVNLARLVDCPALLPLALVICCALGPEALFQGLTREDGSVEKLDEADLMRCMQGSIRLAKEAAAMTVRVFTTAKDWACTRKPDCGTAAETVVRLHSLAEHPHSLALLYPFEDWSHVISRHAPWCPSCREGITSQLRVQRLKL